MKQGRTLAIGDIHGCFRALSSLETFAKIDSEDEIITLGDYVDRGPQTKQVIDWLIDRDATGTLIPLKGNHELMLLSAIASERHLGEWLACGGDTVLESYGAEHPSELPRTHLEFLRRGLRSHAQRGTHFFVHANAHPDIPIDEQPDYMLYWESFGNPAPHQSGKTMVCGHTAQRSGVPKSLRHAICIDTWAYGDGWLTCLDIQAGYCWQADERGNTRDFWLDQGPDNCELNE